MVEVINVTRAGQGWAVKHRGGFLGHAKSYEEAALIGRDLVSWLKSQGRPAELVVSEPRSFAAQKDRSSAASLPSDAGKKCLRQIA